MAERFIYTMQGLSKVYPPKKEVLSNIWLQFYYGAKIGIIGTNGAGKSTLLRIMAGQDREFQGESFLGEGFTVGFLPQEPQLEADLTVRENVELGLREQRDLLRRFEEVSAAFADPDADYEKLGEEQGKLQDAIDACDAWELDRRIEIAMDALNCPPGDSPVDRLSGGEKRRVALARILLEAPDLLLMDEPTNHLDAESVAWLERALQEYRGSVVLVTHDRYFLDNVVGWILELDRGKGIPFEGNYSGWLEQKAKRLAQEEKQESQRRRELERELEWARMSPKARQGKSRARLQRYDELLQQDVQERLSRNAIVIPPGPRLGQKVIEADGVAKAFGDRLLFEDLTFHLPPAGIVGVIGPNGAGKTTLFRLITGEEEPDNGTLTVGETVQLAYVDQSRDALPDDKSVHDVISDGAEVIPLGGRSINSRAYCSLFNFKGADQQKMVGKLSGGERNRVHLARLLKSGANVLLLDEPTNDLDVETLRSLEDGLANFAGCAVIISHDRWFLDRVATHILAFEGNSHVEWFEGNFAEYERDKNRRLGTQDQPQRFRYKPLER
ncbi:MAG: energy-dependent translational throttle protein EttA [Deltaproteobacteria bacterium]|nr:MAG: energy-dependent translational throttle protein EttA [Deltaproteobacteria bacterium]